MENADRESQMKALKCQLYSVIYIIRGVWIQWNGMVDWNGEMEWNGNKLDTSDWFSPSYNDHL